MPLFIDENMLEEAIMEQASGDEEKRIRNQEGIQFNEVVQLSLIFKAIGRVDHLWGFTSLEKLELSNNLIKKIAGLDHLLNLTWLNLSFNSIEKIEGLESLRKLELLSLSNNRISVIENMDTLEKLDQFCIGNNAIGQLDDVLYLRKFKNLFSLNLSGNPASKEEHYKLFIAAYLPKVMYLDSKLLDKETKKKAYMKYQIALEKMGFEELQKAKSKEAVQNQEAIHTNDFVNFEKFLNGCCPSESMLKDDPEEETLRSVPEMAEVMEKFESQMQELCTQIITYSSAEHHRREAEINSFISVQSAAMKDYKKKVSEMLQQNLQRMMVLLQESDPDLPKKEIISQPCNSLIEKEIHVSETEIMVKLLQISDPDLKKEKISLCTDEISQLLPSLMKMECLHISQIESTIKLLEHYLSDMVGNFSETVQGIFIQCRDVDDEYYDKMRKVAVATLETVAHEETHTQDDFIMLFKDRYAVMDALETGHMNHLLKIDDRETKLLTHVNAWKVALIKGIQDKELIGNRTRITDCHRYVVHLREQLEEWQKYPHFDRYYL
ncbi:dynein regulatory complex subunit 3 isoform X2 [Notolabrus celidotus]|uniref:dynein regulatory complex subunit 3 isoform X2 n=1 Tax=Notolabrus celidotus TaxID=1203425 RepID=UPI00148F6350|nr:dynein regulatory complex subunit 3 isoform X2 [Notolabrus celidotus]